MNAIFMEDSEKDVEKKIKKAYCLDGMIRNNPVLEFAKYFIFGKNGKFILDKKFEKTSHVYEKYEDLENDFRDKKIYSDDLKTSLAK